MKKKALVIVIIIAGIGVFLVLSNLKGSSPKTDVDVPEVARYYALREGSIFLKLAKVVDDACYYITDSIIQGISSLFSLFLG